MWSQRGYPSDSTYAEFHRLSMEGTRLWAVSGAPYDPEAAAAKANQQADDFLARVAARLEGFRSERGRNGLVTFAIDTELLGHWWSEGPRWFSSVLSRAEAHGVRLVTLPEALERHEPEARPLRGIDLGGGEGSAHLGLPGGRRPGVGAAAAGAAARQRDRRRRARAGGGGALRARAPGASGERLGVPRPPQAGGGLPVSALHEPRAGAAGGHTLPPPRRSLHAKPGTRP